MKSGGLAPAFASPFARWASEDKEATADKPPFAEGAAMACWKGGFICPILHVTIHPVFRLGHMAIIGHRRIEAGALLGLFVVLLSSCSQEEDDVRTRAIGLNNKAVALFGTEPHKALRLLDDALAIDPSYVLGYSNKATLLSQLDRHEEAAEVMGQALKVKPDSVDVHWVQGWFWEKAGEIQKAQTSYKKAIALFDERLRINPSDSYARAHRAFVLYLTGDKVEALRILDEMLKETPDDLLAQSIKDFIKSGLR